MMKYFQFEYVWRMTLSAHSARKRSPLWTTVTTVTSGADTIGFKEPLPNVTRARASAVADCSVEHNEEVCACESGRVHLGHREAFDRDPGAAIQPDIADVRSRTPRRWPVDNVRRVEARPWTCDTLRQAAARCRATPAQRYRVESAGFPECALRSCAVWSKSSLQSPTCGRRDRVLREWSGGYAGSNEQGSRAWRAVSLGRHGSLPVLTRSTVDRRVRARARTRLLVGCGRVSWKG